MNEETELVVMVTCSSGEGGGSWGTDGRDSVKRVNLEGETIRDVIIQRVRG